MKKYIIFGYDDYYPSGGLNDILKSVDSIEEAKKFIDNSFYNNFEIVDRDTWNIIKEN
jgi:hypothetical protein